MSAPVRDRGRRGLASLWSVAWLVVGCLAYFGLLWLFAIRVQGAGLFSPSGLGDPVLLLLGLATVSLRLALLFVAPGLLAYQVVRRLLPAPSKDRPGPGAPEGEARATARR